MKKYTSLVLSGAIILSTFAPLQANAEETTNEVENYDQAENNAQNKDYALSESATVQQNSDLEQVKKYVTVNLNGHIGFTSVPSDEYEKYDLAELQNYFDFLNQKVDNEQIKINSDLTIKTLGLQLSAVYGKWTYHWWGYDRKFTKKQANAYVDQIEYTIIGLGAGAIVTSPSIIIAGGFGLSAGWYELLAKRIKANNKGKKGVLVKIYWARTFDIVPL
ncbi:hypothetical protein [Rummeliibacillus sp. SL167]|uniref:hypothetical protein n=1 Tax=Rummeliibacillus sp. SL167 TaxID=2579792 RepID=UPI0011B5DA05|nr:hypothetical protein [Rummeliibacillus sp. SL167]